MPRFAPIEKLKAAHQVAGAIREAIVTGQLQPGDGLPSERTLAVDFAVNRSTVREALHHLEAWGMVRIRQGGTTTVQDVLATAGLHVLPWLIAPGGTPDPDLVADLLELRVMILSWSARLAARRGGDAAELTRLCAAMQAGDGDQQALDFAFFEELVALSGNRVLGMLRTALREVYFANRALFSALYTPDLFNPARHAAALEAIIAGDEDAAAAAMAAHARAGLSLSLRRSS